MKKSILLLFVISSLAILSCKKKTSETDNSGPKLIFKFKLDSTLARLDNFGNPAILKAGRSAQNPKFNLLSSHYVELAQNAYVPLGSGAVLYKAKETSIGGSNAIDFDYSKIVAEGEDFLSVPIKDITPGTFKWLRVSLAYQNYDIKYKFNLLNKDYYLTGTIASFVGFNTYIKSYLLKTQTVALNENKSQGYWGFETTGTIKTGQAPAGATTVPNPLSASSPVPPGSCVVTGSFPSSLVITGNETKDITVLVTLSTNNSFEWIDQNSDGWFEPGAGDIVVDMGLRGLYPSIQ